MQINLDLRLNEWEIEEELIKYRRGSYKWKRCGRNGEDIQIWAPNFFIEDSDIIYYFENLKQLEVGNKEHIEVLHCLDLMAILYSTENTKRWNSDYFT